MDPRVERMADVVVNYCVSVKPGQWVIIQSNVQGAAMAEACQRAVLRTGGYPTVFLSTESLELGRLREGSDEQLSYITPAAQVIAEKADARISILAPANTRAMMSSDPARVSLARKAAEPLSAITMRRTSEG